MMDITRAEALIGYHFKDKALLVRAFTHSSYANENIGDPLASNERLEFLGDSVLDTVVSEFLYKSYPRRPEGDLTRIRALVVCESSLGAIAAEAGLSKYILLGRGEEAGGGRGRLSINADMFEAIIAAVYLDGGLPAAQKFAKAMLGPAIEKAAEGSMLSGDPKTALQEFLQSGGTAGISYEIISESGPDHDKSFEAEVSLKGSVIGRGRGHSKKKAEAKAAEDALKKFKNR